MFDNNILFSDTLIATGAVLVNRFATLGGAQATGAAGEIIYGVADYTAAVGDAFAVNVAGKLSVEAGAPVAVGQRVKSDAEGRAIPAAAEDAAAGRAVQAAIGAGYPVRIIRFPTV